MRNLWKRDPMEKTSSDGRQMVWQKVVGAIPECVAFHFFSFLSKFSIGVYVFAMK